MISHELRDQVHLPWVVVMNPIIDLIYFKQICNIRAGQPFMVVKNNKEEVLDLCFSSWELDEEFQVTGTLYEIQWSVGYTEEDAKVIRDTVNVYSHIFVNVIKHKDRDEWAVPFQQAIFDSIPAGDVRDALITQSAIVVSEGRRKTLTELLDDDWI